MAWPSSHCSILSHGATLLFSDNLVLCARRHLPKKEKKTTLFCCLRVDQETWRKLVVVDELSLSQKYDFYKAVFPSNISLFFLAAVPRIRLKDYMGVYRSLGELWREHRCQIHCFLFCTGVLNKWRKLTRG